MSSGEDMVEVCTIVPKALLRDALAVILSMRQDYQASCMMTVDIENAVARLRAAIAQS